MGTRIILDMNKSFILAVGLLSGTIIGAGVFALPYVFQRLGLVVSSLYLVSFALIYFFIHLMYAELVEKHRGTHEFFYLAHQYLPRSIAGTASFLMIAELVLVLVAYLAIAPSFLGLVFTGNNVQLAFWFWAVSSIFIFAPTRWLGRVEILGILGILTVIFLIFTAGGTALNNLNMAPRGVNFSLLILPFGPLLFAFSGRPAISKVIDLYRKTEKHKDQKTFSLKRVIFWGTVLPAVIYLFFVIAVLRLTPAPGEDTISSLGFLSPEMLVALGVLGVVTIWTSYFMIGANVREIVKEDVGWSRTAATFLAVVLPIFLYMLGWDSFFRVIAFTGGVMLGLEAIFIVTMWRKAFRYHRFRTLSLLLYPVFVVAMGYQLWLLVN